MAKIHTIDRADADDALARVYASIMGRSTAEPANILKVQSLSPDTLETHFRYYRALMFGKSPLSRAQRELLAVATSQANECHY